MAPSPLLLLDRLFAHELVRFVITGGSAAVLFYLLTFGLIRAGAPPFSGTLGAYAVVMVATYTVQHAWTFRGAAAHTRSFPRYLATQAVASLTASSMARLAGNAGAAPALVALASTLSGSALSFVLSKFWVFARRTPVSS